MNKKFKNFILKGLITSILLSGVPIISSASTFSEDGRYETVKGSNIKIENILEPNTLDIDEVYGNTLINTLDYSIFSTLSNKPNSLGISINGKEITRDYSVTTGVEGSWSSSSILIRKDVTYTFVADIISNTTSDKVELFPFMWRYGTQKKGSEYVTPGYTGKIVVSFTSNADETLRLLHENSGRDITGSITISNLMLLRGDYYDEFTSGKSKVPNYFEGVQSVGENDNESEIYSSNSITENSYYIKGYGLVSGNTSLYKASTRNVLDFTSVEPNTAYKVNHNGVYVLNFYNKNKEYLGYINDVGTFTTPSNCYYIKASIDITRGDKVSIVKSKEDFKGNVFDLKLDKPLRSLQNGVEDKIIKKGGQWFVERNVGSLILDDSHGIIIENNPNYYRFVISNIPNIYYSNDRSPVISKDFFTHVFSDNESSDNLTHKEGLIFERYGKIYVYKTLDGVNEFRTWMKNNSQELLYRLNKPVYEPLGIRPSVDIYDDVTYISATCNIPTKLQVAVDRAANKAKEYSEIAKLNPTVENISQARYWVNLMKDSILKDEFQSDINSVFNIENLEIEKKTVSANVDVYIAMKNTLSMSLDTNSISFKGYTGSEDLEMLEALNITIDSSLPYNLNAYMPSGIYNSDKSKSMNINVLNLKESTESAYKQFTSTNDKLILKENCSEGEAKVHSIDLKLSGGSTHKADIYKTVLKFEAEQK